jgi:hypothetical protein
VLWNLIELEDVRQCVVDRGFHLTLIAFALSNAPKLNRHTQIYEMLVTLFQQIAAHSEQVRVQMVNAGILKFLGDILDHGWIMDPRDPYVQYMACLCVCHLARAHQNVAPIAQQKLFSKIFLYMHSYSPYRISSYETTLVWVTVTPWVDLAMHDLEVVQSHVSQLEAQLGGQLEAEQYALQHICMGAYSLAVLSFGRENREIFARQRYMEALLQMATSAHEQIRKYGATAIGNFGVEAILRGECQHTNYIQ